MTNTVYLVRRVTGAVFGIDSECNMHVQTVVKEHLTLIQQPAVKT